MVYRETKDILHPVSDLDIDENDVNDLINGAFSSNATTFAASVKKNLRDKRQVLQPGSPDLKRIKALEKKLSESEKGSRK